MGFYDALYIPQTCLVDKTVAKKCFSIMPISPNRTKHFSQRL